MFQALRNRNVGLLFGAQIISIAGDMVMFVALPFWVFQLTGSAAATGIMFAALTIPQLVFSPIAGVFVDRLDRKRVMIVADVLRALLVLGYLFVNSAEQVWVIYVLAFLESTVSQFFRPSVMAIVPTLVNSEEELTQANAALGSSWAVGQLAGPALGGVLVAAYGPHAAALFDSASYLLSMALVVLMAVPAREAISAKLTDARQAVGEITRELLEGVRVVVSRPLLRVVFGSLALLFFAQGVINVLLVVIINDLWHTGAQQFGWLISAQGIGGVIGAVLAGAIAKRVSPRAMVVGGGALAGAMFLVIVNQPSVYVALGLMVVLGMAVVSFDVGLTTLLQLGSDDANRGRVSALMQTVMAAAQLISIGLTSLLADRLGPMVLLDVAGVVFISGGLVALFAPAMKPSDTPLLQASQPAE